MSAILLLTLQALILPPSIQAWRADLEREFKIRVPVVWAGSHLLGDSDGFSLARNQLEQEGFRRQFSMMQAATIRQSLTDTDRFVILLNPGWLDSYKGFEDVLLGHEFGHVWLLARKLPAPVFAGSALGCLSIHSGDVVEHVLIRAEMDRRGINHRAFFQKNLDTSANSLNEASRAVDPCAWARQAALWVDARLAFEGHEWPRRAEYEAAAEKYLPEAVAAGRRILPFIENKDLNEPAAHRQALIGVHQVLQELARKQRDSQAP